MTGNKFLQNSLLLGGMIGLILLGFIFDLLINSLVERNSQTGGLEVTLVWLFPLMQFLWMVALVGLIWLMIRGGGYSRMISVLYIGVGLLILYTNPILFVNELPDSFYVVVQYLNPGSLLFQSGGAIAAIGLLSLWFWKEADDTEGDLSRGDESQREESDEANEAEKLI